MPWLLLTFPGGVSPWHVGKKRGLFLDITVDPAASSVHARSYKKKMFPKLKKICYSPPAVKNSSKKTTNKSM